MFQKDVHDLVRSRISCRSFRNMNISDKQIDLLEEAIQQLPEPPLGSSVRFMIEAAKENEMERIKKLGTYGTIKNPRAFLMGACQDTREALVDFGYLTELLVLKMEEIGLGSCWLGGSFQKSRFAECMMCAENEIVPSVIAMGIPMESPTLMDRFIRLNAKSRKRKSWNDLFFVNDFQTPLSKEQAGNMAESLEMVRLAPSASNKQPWRVLFEESKKSFHFILERTGNYHKVFDLLKLPDLQKIDLGIGLAHFDCSVRAKNISGHWNQNTVLPVQMPDNAEYILSWKSNH